MVSLAGPELVPPRRALTAALLVVLVSASLPVSAVQVQPADETLPHPLYGYGMARLGETTYLVGGSGEDRGFSDEILAMSEDGTTSVATTLPHGLLEPAVASIGSTVYIFGGAREPQQGGLPTTTDTIYRFDPSTGSVEELVGTTLPEAVSSASAVRLGGYLYILGGLTIESGANGGSIDWRETIARFDPGGPSVREMSVTLPTGTGQSAAVVSDGTALLLGGMAESTNQMPCPGNATTCPSDAIVRFNPSASTAGQIGSLPDRIRWAAASAHEGTVYLMGGCRSNCGGHYGSDEMVTIDPDDGATETLPVTMPVKGGRNSAALYDDLALVPGGVRANGTGTVSHASVHRIQLGVTPPWAPGNLSAAAGEEGAVRLSWDPPAYDGGADVTGYRVLRATGAEAPTLLKRVEGTTYTDRSAELGTTYRYSVRAVNPAGIGTASNLAAFTPTDTPGPPTLTVRGGDAKLVAQWSPPEDTGGSNVTGYQLLVHSADANVSSTRCRDVTCLNFEPAVRYFEIERFGDETVENGESYVVQIRAQNQHGWGPASPEERVTAHPVPDPPSNLRFTKGLVGGEPVVNLTWKASPSQETTGYRIYRGPTLAELSPIGSTEILSFTDDQDVPQGVELLYAVAATTDGREGPPSQAIRAVFPEPPEPVRNLTARLEGSTVVVTWRTPGGLGGGVLEGYEVARTRGAISPEETNATLHQVGEPAYRDESPPRGQPATYHVRAVTTGGTGDWTMTQIRIPGSSSDAPPQAVLSARPSNVRVGQNVAFDASGSQDESGIAAYKFIFGDGEATAWRNEPRAAHVYETRGVYTAELIVRDVSGRESTPATATIAVGEPKDTQDGGEPNVTDGPDGDDNGIPVPTWVPAAAVALTALAAQRRRRR